MGGQDWDLNQTYSAVSRSGWCLHLKLVAADTVGLRVAHPIGCWCGSTGFKLCRKTKADIATAAIAGGCACGACKLVRHTLAALITTAVGSWRSVRCKVIIGQRALGQVC